MTTVGKINSIKEGQAEVLHCGKKAMVSLGLVSDVRVGDWILYASNQAVKRITEEDAREIEVLMDTTIGAE